MKKKKEGENLNAHINTFGPVMMYVASKYFFHLGNTFRLKKEYLRRKVFPDHALKFKVRSAKTLLKV